MRGAFDSVLDLIEVINAIDETDLLASEEGIVGAESRSDARRRNEFQRQADTQQEAGSRDEPMEPGTKVWVEQQPGMGVGTYVSFERKMMGANVHTIKFDNARRGAAPTSKPLKLKELHWCVLLAAGEGEQQ